MVRPLSVTVLMAVAALPAVAPHAAADEPAPGACGWALTPVNAEVIFVRFKAATAGGCAVRAATTDQSTMTVTWQDPDGHAHDVVVRPAACLGDADLPGPQFAASTSPGFRDACPATAAALAKVLASAELGAAAPVGEGSGPGHVAQATSHTVASVLRYVVGPAVLAALAVVLAWWRARRRAGGPRTRLSPRIRRTLLVVGGSLASLALLELGCLLFVERMLAFRIHGLDNSLARPDPQLGFVLPPGDHHGNHINQLGLRGPEVALHKAPGCRRILALGGSTTYGNTVAATEAYPAVLERLLAAREPSSCVEVINAGLPGASSAHHVVRYRTIYAGLALDVVVIYVGWNDYANFVWLGDDWTPETLAAPSVVLDVGPFTRAALRASALVRVLYGAYLRRTFMNGLRAARGSDAKRFFAPATAALRRHLDDIVTMARAGGAEVLLVKFPGVHDDAHLAEDLQALRHADVPEAVKKTAELFAVRPGVPALAGAVYDDLATRPGVSVVDCATEFVHMPILERARLFDDAIHPNAEGYRRIAACIARAL